MSISSTPRHSATLARLESPFPLLGLGECAEEKKTADGIKMQFTEKSVSLYTSTHYKILQEKSTWSYCCDDVMLPLEGWCHLGNALETYLLDN